MEEKASLIINKPELVEMENGKVRAQSLIITQEGERVLWFELDAKYKDGLTLDRLDAFVVAMLFYAMKNNLELVVDGPISNKLARNLKYYMHVMNMYFPHLPVISLHFSKRDPLLQCPKGSGVVSSFTAGIDSYYTLWENFKNSESDADRITHLVYVYAGQKGWGEIEGRTIFKESLPIIKEAAKQLNLELVAIDSNLDSFYPDRIAEAHGARLSCCVLLLQKLFSIYYIPSTFQYCDFVHEGSSPLGDHLLSTEVMDIVHDGAQYSRVEKTKIISEWEITQSFLIVCNWSLMDGKTNCSNCEKCLRTMIALDMLGLRKQYEKILDFTDFETKRDLYICNRFLTSLVEVNIFTPFWKEVKKYAKDAGYPLKVKPGKLLLAIWLKIKKNPAGRIKGILKRF